MPAARDGRAHRPGRGPAATLIFSARLDAAAFPDAMGFAPQLRRAVESLDRNLTVHRVLSMERIMAGRLATRRLNMTVLGVFTAIALVLASIGVYGVLAYAVERGTREIGVRIALGAGRDDVMRLVARETFLLAAAGCVLGLAAAAGLTRLASGLFYEVTATDPPTYVGAALRVSGGEPGGCRLCPGVPALGCF